MFLRQLRPRISALPLGSKNNPILIDSDTEELPTVLSTHPNSALEQTSSSMPPTNSSNMSYISSSSVIADKAQVPMPATTDPIPKLTSMNRDNANQTRTDSKMFLSGATGPQSRKRKRDEIVDSSEVKADTAKKIKKDAKKRRKRERRAARLAQLPDHVSLTAASTQRPNLGPSYPTQWSAPHQLPPIYLNFDVLPDKPSWESAFQDFSGSHYASFENHHHHLSATQVVPDSRWSDMEADNFVYRSSSGHSSSTSSSLSHHFDQRNSEFTTSQSTSNVSHVSAPPPLHPKSSIDNVITNKQLLLDRAISDNKKTLEQLSANTTPEKKSSLMKLFAERTKIVAQLTSEIKAHLATLKPNAASFPSQFKSRFKWPQTELPLVILTSDEEDSDNEM